ncbi:hypothetical protein ACQ4PT_024298 [Festuca glaucescens]
MDPSAATGQSTRDAHAHLSSFFLDAMRLGEPSPPERQRHAPLAPPPSRGQQLDRSYVAVFAEMASPPPALQLKMSPMSKMMQELEITRQFWPPSKPYASLARSSNRDGYASQIGGAAFTKNTTQSGTQHQSGPSSSAQQPLRASARQYQPGPVAASLTVSHYQQPYYASQYQPEQVAAPLTASQYQPYYASQYQPERVAAPQTASQYQPYASQYQSEPAAATLAASQYEPYAIVPHQSEYGSSFHQRMRAIQAAQAQAMPSRARRCRTLEETRSALLSGAPMELQLVTFPDSAAHVIYLLLHRDGEGYEQILRSVLAGVTRGVHDFIDNKEGHKVLVELLGACAGRQDEVKAIVQAALAPDANGTRYSLLRSTKHDYWEKCVRELMTAAAPYPDLSAMLVDRLMCEGLLKHDRGDQLLQHCFATTRHQDTVIVLQCALDKIDDMIGTASGAKCLVECYARATGHQLQAFNDILLARALEIATGKFSNYFMQHILEHGDAETSRLLVERLMADVVQLSLHSIGSYVVEACYQKAGLLPLVLAAFLRLDDDYLAQLVQGAYANYVVHKLLDTAIHVFPRETMALVRRIDGLPQHVTRRPYARKVMMVVLKLLARYGRMYA